MKGEKVIKETYKYTANDGTEFDNAIDCRHYENMQQFKVVMDDPECGYMPELDDRFPLGLWGSDDKNYFWFRPTTIEAALKLYAMTERIDYKTVGYSIDVAKRFIGCIICLEYDGDCYYDIVDENIKDVIDTLEKLGYKVEKIEAAK